MRAYDGDPDAFVGENRETLVRLLKHTDDVFVRALALATLVEYGTEPALDDVERELRKARDTETEDG